MAFVSPVSHRLTVTALLLWTFATGLVDAISVLVLGHVFVANMTGNVIFLGFWLAPHTVVDKVAVVVACVCFLIGTIIGARFARQRDNEARRWLTAAIGLEIVLLAGLTALVAAGILTEQGTGRLILIAVLAVAFGAQSAAAREFGVQELSTTVVTSTILGIGADSRLAGGTGERTKLRITVVATMVAGAAVGATLLHIGLAPVIGLAAVFIAAGLVIFRYGPPAPAALAGSESHT